MLENNVSHARPRSIAAYARLFLTGCAMGAADLVPGVSGGTMAFVLGVCQDLLDGIRSFNLLAPSPSAAFSQPKKTVSRNQVSKLPRSS